MSTQSSSMQQNLDFAPLHRTTELENIHEQVIQNDSPQEQKQPSTTTTTRKVLMKHMTVIGDGSDRDNHNIITQ